MVRSGTDSEDDSDIDCEELICRKSEEKALGDRKTQLHDRKSDELELKRQEVLDETHVASAHKNSKENMQGTNDSEIHLFDTG